MQEQSSPQHLEPYSLCFQKINICHVCTELRCKDLTSLEFSSAKLVVVVP